MKTYPEYKTTGLDWLPQVPAHWEVKPLRSSLQPKSIRNKSDSLLLSVYREYGVIPKDSRDDNRNVESEDLTNYKFVEVGNLVMNKMKTWQGSLAISDYEGIVSPAYIVCAVRGNWDKKYLHLLLRTPIFIGVYNSISYGVRVGQWDMRWEDFKKIPIPIPPLPEQRAIVEYLTAKGREIETYIATKTALLERLREWQATRIAELVTKGLDPDPQREYCGLDWLGDIPAHWEVKKLKYVARINPGKSESIQDAKDCVFLPMEAVSSEGEILQQFKRAVEEVREGFTYFERGDVVVAKITPCFENGKGACLDFLETDFGFGTTEFHVLRAGKKILPRYLYFFTASKTFRRLATEFMTGAAGQKRVPTQFIANFPTPLPPLSEQCAIVSQIEADVAIVNAARERAAREISLARELWQSLVAEVVTGKRDVRAQ